MAEAGDGPGSPADWADGRDDRQGDGASGEAEDDGGNPVGTTPTPPMSRNPSARDWSAISSLTTAGLHRWSNNQFVYELVEAPPLRCCSGAGHVGGIKLGSRCLYQVRKPAYGPAHSAPWPPGVLWWVSVVCAESGDRHG